MARNIDGGNMLESIRSKYANENLDKIICYFMKTILYLQNTGIEDLPLKNDFDEPLKTFIDIAIELIIDGQPPEISRLILDSEYDVILNNNQITVEEAINLRMIKELSWHIHYDRDYYEYLLSTDNLWGNTTFEYASRTFYPNLPGEIQRKYQIDNLIRHIPQEIFRLKDY